MEDQSKGHAVSLLFWTEPWLIIANNFLIGFRPSVARLPPQLFYCTPERRRCRKIAVPRNTIRHTARLNLAMCLSLQSYCPFATSLLARSETSNRDLLRCTYYRCVGKGLVTFQEQGSSSHCLRNQGNAADSGLKAFIRAMRRLG
jgi:hypothetical protein